MIICGKFSLVIKLNIAFPLSTSFWDFLRYCWFHSHTLSKVQHQLLRLFPTLVTLCIWKARCSIIFEGVSNSAFNIIKAVLLLYEKLSIAKPFNCAKYHGGYGVCKQWLVAFYSAIETKAFSPNSLAIPIDTIFIR